MAAGPPAGTTREFGALLRSRRRQLGLTQAAVAATAGVSRAFVVGIESGRRSGAELGRVLAVARALGVGVRLEPLPEWGRSLEEILQDLL